MALISPSLPAAQDRAFGWLPERIQSIAGGLTQVVILTRDGSVWTMGSNTRGQLGIGTIGVDAWSSVPVRVDLPGPMRQVGSGTAECWALSADGRSIYTWGDNTNGQLGIGNSAVKYSTVPRKVDLDLPPGVSVVSMGGGSRCTLALLSNGQVMAWGDNQYGQCGLNPATAGKYIYKPTLIPGLTGVTSVASGDFHSMALEQNGTVWAWGDNHDGQLGPQGPAPGGHDSHTYVPVQVTGLPPIQSIVAGGRHGAALDDNGNIWEWGRNKFGELGNGTIDLSNGPHPTPTMVAGLPKIVSFASEGPTMLASDACGDVYAWGFNKWGAVGNGQTANTGTPQLVLTVPTAPDASAPSVQVAAAHWSSYAFDPVTGEIYAWGENNYGQIGIPANHSPNPTPVNITSEILPTLRDPAVAASAPDPVAVLNDLIGPTWSNGPFWLSAAAMGEPPAASGLALMPSAANPAGLGGGANADLLPWLCRAASSPGASQPGTANPAAWSYPGDHVAACGGLLDTAWGVSCPWP